jgi:uracil-DNA glycosylase
MHGTDDDRLDAARRCCVPVLAAQIDTLQPSVIIASGREAAASLHEIGLLRQVWPQFLSELATRAHREEATL